MEAIDPVLNPVLNREIHKAGGRRLVRLGDQDIDFSHTFTMFMSTRDSTFAFPPDLCSRVTFVNFTVTPGSLQRQCLSAVLKSERPDIDAKRTELLKLQGEYQARLRELEDGLLDTLNSVEGNILDNDIVIQQLQTLKSESAEVVRKSGEAEVVMGEVEEVSQTYKPVSEMASGMFFAMETLPEVHFLYHFSLQSFLDILDFVLHSDECASIIAKAGGGSGDAGEAKGGGDKNAPPRGDPLARLIKLKALLFEECFKRTRCSLLNEDAVVFAARLAQIRLRYDPALQVDEASRDTTGRVLEHLMRGLGGDAPSSAAVSDASGALPEGTLSRAQVQKQASLLPVGARGEAKVTLLASMRNNGDDWVRFLSAKADDAFTLPEGMTENADAALQSAAAVAVVQALRPDRVGAALERFVEAVFPVEETALFSQPELDLSEVVERWSSASSPLLLCSRAGYDASGKVDALAAAAKVKYKSLAMGSEEGFDMADKYVNAASREGSWVLLRNVHLCPTWLISLEKKLHGLSPHPEFRLFLTAEIHPKLPSNLLRLSHVIALEPPAGIKASLQRSLRSMPEARMNKAPAERSRLYFLLAWCHATILERLQFAPVGWSKTYEFSDADRYVLLPLDRSVTVRPGYR